MTPTVRELVDRAIAAHRALAAVGDEIEDEAQYVVDLAAVWQARLSRIAAERGSDEVAAEVGAAIAAAIDEAGRIDDAHRAIDWLSTFPQIVLLALGESA